jgi:hypothetical protein
LILIINQRRFYNFLFQTTFIHIHMSLSASKMKQGGLTALEMQAQNIA